MTHDQEVELVMHTLALMLSEIQKLNARMGEIIVLLKVQEARFAEPQQL